MYVVQIVLQDSFKVSWNIQYKLFKYVVQVINKGYFSEAFLFKPRGGRSPPSGLNKKAEEKSFI